MSEVYSNHEKLNIAEYDLDRVIREITTSLNQREVEGVDEALEVAYNFVVNSHDKLNLGNIIFLKGSLASANDQFKHAILYYKQAMSIFEELGNLKRSIDSLLKIGRIQGDIGHIDDALKTYYLALEKINEKGKYIANKGRIKNNIGHIYQNLYDYENALKFYVESLNIFKRQKMKDALPIVTYNIASVNFFMNDYEKSKIYVDLSLKYAKEMDSELDYIFSQFIDHLLQYRIDKNEDVFIERTNDLFNKVKDIGDSRDESDIYKLYAKAMFHLGEFDKAKDKLEEIYPKVLESDLVSVLVEIGDLLEKVYVELGDYKAAYEISKVTLEKKENELSLDESNMKEMVSGYEALENEGYVYNLKNNLRIVKLLSKIGEGITYNRDVTSIFDFIVEQVYDIWELDVFGLGVKSEDSRTLEYHYHTKDEGTKIGEIELHKENVLMNYCVLNEEEIIIQDTMVTNNYKDRFSEELVKAIHEDKVCSIVFLPIYTDKGVMGGITIQSKISDHFKTQDLEELRILASYCSAAVTNYKRHLKLIKIKDYDGLTEVYNRHALINKNSFIEKNKKEMKLPMFVGMFDIDYFKLFNDNYGHLEGDQVLIDITKTTNAVVTTYGGEMYRYGGDEFVIFIDNMDKKQAKEFLDELMASIYQAKIPHEYHKSSNQITISLGGVIIDSFDKETMNDYYKEIDKLLYEVKNKGRDGYYLSSAKPC